MRTKQGTLRGYTCAGRGILKEVRELTPEEAQWWMGGFALVLADVKPLPFTPCKGALGFFKVPPAAPKALARADRHG